MGKTIGLIANNVLVCLLYAAVLIFGYSYLQNFIFLIGAVVFALGVIVNDILLNKKSFMKSCKDHLILILLLEVILVVITLIALWFSVDAMESTSLTYQVWCFTICTFLAITFLFVKDGIYWIKTANLKIKKYIIPHQGKKLAALYIAGIIFFVLLILGLNELFSYVIFDSDLEHSLATYLPYAALFGIWRTFGFKIINSDAEKYYQEHEEELLAAEINITEAQPEIVAETIEEKKQQIDSMINEEIQNEEQDETETIADIEMNKEE